MVVKSKFRKLKFALIIFGAALPWTQIISFINDYQNRTHLSNFIHLIFLTFLPLAILTINSVSLTDKFIIKKYFLPFFNRELEWQKVDHYFIHSFEEEGVSSESLWIVKDKKIFKIISKDDYSNYDELKTVVANKLKLKNNISISRSEQFLGSVGFKLKKLP